MLTLIAWGIMALAACGCAADTLWRSDAEALCVRRFKDYRAGNLTAIYDPIEPVIAGSD